MSNIGILIYARDSSKRLPGKVLKKIYKNKTLLEVVFRRINKFLNNKIIVCTSNLKSDDRIINFCKKKKITYFRGSLNNVFKRTVNCLLKFNLDSFVRINADRPFVDYNEIKKMIKIFRKNKFDIISNNSKKNCPKGLVCEIAKSEIFIHLKNKKINKNNQEHIFNYFYKNCKKYKILFLNNKIYQKNYTKNLSIDFFEDLKKVRKIYNEFKNLYVPTNKIFKSNFL